MAKNGVWRPGPRRKRPKTDPEANLETQIKFDNPDDAELEPEQDLSAVVDDVDSQVVLDNPDDGDLYPPGEEPGNG